MHPEIQQKVKEIESDHQSGSAKLAIKAAHIYELFGKLYPNSTVEMILTTLHELSCQLNKAQPKMAPIITFTLHMDHFIKQSQTETNEKICKLISEEAKNYRMNMLQSQDKITHVLDGILKDTQQLITLSHSSTLLSALIALHNKGKSFKVIATESRPALEGVEFVKQLALAGIPCLLITDAALLKHLEKADVAMVGADCITENYFINKVGTLSLALGCKEYAKDFFVIADSSKFIPDSWMPLGEREHPTEEIFQEAIPHIHISNFYFEKIPLDKATGFITEKGILDPKEIPAVVRAIRG